MKCSNCNAEVKDGMKFCPKCGEIIPQIRYCSNCGTELKDGMRFCQKCGQRYQELDGIKKESQINSDAISSNYNSYESQSLNQSGKDNSYQNQTLSFADVNSISEESILNSNMIFNILYWGVICVVALFIIPGFWSAIMLGIGGMIIFNRKWGWDTWKLYASLSVLFLVCFLIFGNISDTYEESGREAVLRELKAPSTAVFISYIGPSKANAVYEDYLKTKFKDNQDVAVFEVEAENSFGGRVRNYFYVFYVDKKPIGVLEEETALNPNRNVVLGALEYNGWNK